MKSKSLLLSIVFLAVFFVTGFLAPRGASAASTKTGYEGDFFIISSVNLRSHELFLKAPTEVTELMTINDGTVFLDEQGKRLEFKDLRAGDTVYVVSKKSGKNLPVATRIQKGPMTNAILHQRYLAFR